MMRINNNIAIIIGFLISVLTSADVLAAESAAQIMEKAAAKINGAGGVSASFTLTSGHQTAKGTIKASGKKFVIETPGYSTWYDGKNMWTYNERSNETTLIEPTAAEIAEANPLALVNTYTKDFTASFAKSQTKGSKSIILTPKSKALGYKSVHVTLSDQTGLPTKVVVIPQSGTRIDVSIFQVKTKQQFAASTFTYPKSKYPKAEINDMR